MYVKVASPQIDDADIAQAVAALRSGTLTSGPMVAEFERAFAAKIGTEHAVAVNSGTAALHAALAAAGVGFGDEVVVPALTFFSTVTSVIHQYGVPVFADIDPVTYSLCPESFAAAITPRTRAVIPVHYFGHSAEMDPIMEVARARGITVIEDCAQSHGTIYRGRMTGAIGDFGAFSMFATKHITTCEGGVITTDDAEAAEYCRRFRSHGLVGRNDHEILGYNYRMPEPLGAIGTTQLARLDALNDARIAASERMVAAIRDIPWLRVPEVPAHIRHTYFWCHVWIDEDRLGMSTAELIGVLRDKGIECRNRYEAPLYRQPLLTSNLPQVLRISAGDNLPDYGAMHLPNAEAIAGRVIGLPNRPDLSDDEIAHVAGVLRGLGADVAA